MCTLYSHLPALVRLNQAEKDNEAFYLDATDFIFSSRFVTLCPRVRGSHSLGARFLLYRRRKVGGEKKMRRIQRNVGFIKDAVLSKHILVKLYSSLSPRNPLLLQ